MLKTGLTPNNHSMFKDKDFQSIISSWGGAGALFAFAIWRTCSRISLTPPRGFAVILESLPGPLSALSPPGAGKGDYYQCSSIDSYR